ncbi:MAG: helix-turn-helix domain-containing protein, partial [Planctomycetes bacterium]|nr:helix-turn-helix domain-containing protein [Planctomycetota bacterium]
LRFGAGLKGKIVSSLAAGVPCVATPMAAEGMALIDGEHVCLATTPSEFAAAVVDVHEDTELWERLWRTCPERHRAVLVLKRQGRSLDEIAAHTGLHKSSVRRLLYALFSGLENAREPEGPK